MTKKYHDAFHALDENDRDDQKADGTEDCLFFVGGNNRKKLAIKSKAYRKVQKLFEGNDDACEKSDDGLGLQEAPKEEIKQSEAGRKEQEGTKGLDRQED